MLVYFQSEFYFKSISARQKSVVGGARGWGGGGWGGGVKRITVQCTFKLNADWEGVRI